MSFFHPFFTLILILFLYKDPNPHFEVDTVLYSKAESLVRVVRETMKKKNVKDEENKNPHIPLCLEAYIPRALQEYSLLRERYAQWELTNSPPPRLVTVSAGKEFKG